MKKKIYYLILILLLPFVLISCGDDGKTDEPDNPDTPPVTPTEKAVPEFFGGKDAQVKLNSGEIYNPFSGLEVWANGSDITDMVLYTIYDVMKNDEIVTEISLSKGGTYKIVYIVPETQTIKKATLTRTIIVGSGYSDFNYDENNLTYNLVWSDEFDGDSLNTNNWNYEIGTGSGGWGNNELQYYTSSTNNCYVENGFLNIKAIKENKAGCKYTSSRITTARKADFKYGRIEARIKIPQGRGIWPAFWMMPTNSVYGGWPNSGEIDIMEHVGYNPFVIHSTVHNKSYNGMIGTQKGSSRSFKDIYDTYHVYSCEWFPDKIVFYVDDTKIFEYAPTNRTQSNWPYDQEFFIIFNVAVGGNWGGAQGVDDTIFPQTMSVDYVRVYQAKELEIYK